LSCRCPGSLPHHGSWPHPNETTGRCRGRPTRKREAAHPHEVNLNCEQERAPCRRFVEGATGESCGNVANSHPAAIVRQLLVHCQRRGGHLGCPIRAEPARKHGLRTFSRGRGLEGLRHTR
jgi:hypothetical protein